MIMTSPVLCASGGFYFLLRRLHFNFLYLLSPDESDSLDGESEELGSDSISSGKYSFCAFTFRFDKSVDSVSVLGSDVSAPTVAEPKGSRLLAFFWLSNSRFPSKFQNQFYSYSLTLRSLFL